MKRIGIICKKGKAEPIALLKELLPWLSERGLTVFADSDAAQVLGIRGYERCALPDLVDMIIVLGGDGTMLSVARLIAQRDIPIFGINLGGLGFITEVSKGEALDALEKVIADDYVIEDRIMLHTRIIRQGQSHEEFTVLNDVVINKGALARIFDIEIFIERKYVTTFKADGLIISTPTGSTAYSLSAGGPILYPTLHCIVITPICSHTLTNRPIVIGDGMLIEARVNPGSKDISLTLDGQIGRALCDNDVIEIRKSDHVARLLLPAQRDYFQVLREKLKWGER
ncbi:MAG: NAD(+)/NADH kinase [Nitrospirae bacterium]|uniref:NAD(+)/NADH kinase n=1 Tax=Candidatus Magnetobacterium casense TaxID=1455061 RepID=UPI00058DC82E|nr:NAD(+)/NADH kinase [Candidatus Magnetobacterium casensis]MBF0337578.1 NAD(+)/NADH kinase [Nitrospirota bacterium]